MKKRAVYLLLILGGLGSIVFSLRMLREAATLDPAPFTGRAREAYQAARDYPNVLSELPCFCGCMRHMGHNSNLDCFKDSHGAICSMCQDIALTARDMARRGEPIDKIVEEVRTLYGPSRTTSSSRN